MPIPNATYRWKTLPNGKKIRLAFVKGQVVETKNQAGDTHMITPHKPTMKHQMTALKKKKA